MREKLNLKKQMSRSRRIILGFLVIILVGAGLLMLPISAKPGQTTTPVGALFTSVSATCVTGLIRYDTFSHWSLFGQIILLLEIQIGGLGFITVTTFLMILAHRKIGVTRRALIQDSLSTMQIKGSVNLVRRIIIGTFLFEGIGAVLLTLRFAQDMNLLQAMWFGIFHSISAFCNAGFDLMGYFAPFNSLCGYANDPLVILVVSALIIIGGLGFVVWQDFWENRLQYHKYSLQTKMVLAMTSFLLVSATVLFWINEKHNLLEGMSVSDAFLASFFSAVTPRTAGFNSIDTASLTSGSLFLTILLMFIGGSPGSTAGGIKTITLFILLLHLKAYLFNEKEVYIFRRKISGELVEKAVIVCMINLLLAIGGMFLILSVQPLLSYSDVMFEVFSAIGTSGMSTGVTRDLNLVSQCVIMLLMFLGRMGSLTFALSLTESRKARKIGYVEGTVPIG